MKKAILVIAILLIPIASHSQEIGDYLILEDIGPYKIAMPEKLFPGEPPSGGPRSYEGPGILGATGHFTDHNYRTYTAIYLGANDDLASPTVEVTQHVGGNSDRWLAHEAERDFRNYYGLPGDSYVMRNIEGNTVMAIGAGGWDYRWLSGNKLIHIEYTDLMMTEPEPLEVVKAYLAKHPSTLPSMTSADLRTEENKTKWIKDEMERRLWLSDKWLAQLQAGKTQISYALKEIVEHLEVFLDYREKYYGISAGEEKQILYGYLQALNGTEIRKKVTQYKQWCAENQTKRINLP